MKCHFSVLSFALLLGAVSTGRAAATLDPAAAPTPGMGGFAPGVLLVKWNPASAQTDALAETGTRVLAEYPFIGWQRLALPDGMSVPDAVAAFRARQDVLYAEPDYVCHFDNVPNDPMYAQQWAPPKIGLPTAWNTTTGSANVVVASIDTGVNYNHPDLMANLWHNPGEIAGNGIDDDHDGYVDDVYGINAYLNTGDPADDTVGHGTWTSGCIGATGNNSVGVAGANWTVRLMALKVNQTNANSFFDSAAIAGYQYAVMQKSKGVNVRVINNSWGGYGFDQSLKDAIDAASAAGILTVCSAGNGDANGNPVNTDVLPLYPAGDLSSSSMSIAASDSSDSAATFTNYGPRTVDMAAPGVLVLTTAVGGGYQSVNGTSFSAPYVSGTAALMLAESSALTPADIKIALDASTDILTQWGSNTKSGGRLNAGTAVQNTILPLHMVFAAQPSDAKAGTFATQPTVNVLDSTGQISSSFSGPVTLAIRAMSGQSGAALAGTKTVNAVHGVAKFTGLGITTVGANYVLSATSPSVRPVLSQPFTIGLARVYVSKTGSDTQAGDTWAHARLTLASGISVATGTGAEVWVGAGTYTERVALLSGAGLYGGFAGTETAKDQRNVSAHVSTISGSAATGCVVTIATTATAATVIDGFTITGGKGPNGGGITCWFGSPTITNNVITGNTATGTGGGIDCESGNPDIEGNTITSNSAPFGGGIYLFDAGGKVSGNTIASNNGTTTGGGLDIDTCPSALTLHGNILRGNISPYGAGLRCRAAAPVIEDNLFVANAAQTYGGGIFGVLAGANPAIVNNTFASNTSGNLGGGMVFTQGAAPTVINNIVVSGNSGIYSDGTVTVTRRNNDVFGNGSSNNSGTTPGVNEISVDPAFVNTANGDYSLLATSPCIDAGYDAAVAAGDTDLAGDARILGTHVDIGAYEYDPAHAPFTISEAAAALRIAGGLVAATTADMTRLNVTTPARIDIVDAVHIARKIAGLETNP